METYISNDVKTAIISTVIVMNIITNCLVIAVIACNSELREDRTTLFMFSLSLSDLAAGCTVMPISAAVCSDASPSVKHMTILPDLHMFFLWWISFNSLQSLCWLTVLKPFRYEQPLLRRHHLQLGRRCRFSSNQVHGTSRVCSSSERTTIFPLYVRRHGRCPSLRTPSRSLSLFTYAVTVVVPLYVRRHGRCPSLRTPSRPRHRSLFFSTPRREFIFIVRTHTRISAQVHVIDAGTGSAGLVTLRAIRSARNVLIICSVSMILTIPLIVFALMRHTGHGKTMTQDSKFFAIWLFSCNTFMNSFLYIVLHRSLRRKTRLLFIYVCQLCRDG